MRNMNDLKYAFGEADTAFQNKVYRTLRELQASKEKAHMKTINKRFIAAVVIISTLMIATTALALSNAWGILDFLTGRQNVAVLPEAENLIIKESPQQGTLPESTASAQTGAQEGSFATVYASFHVRESIFDGQNVYLVMEVRPLSPEYLLLGADAWPTDPVGNMGPLFQNVDGTIAEYAAAHQQQPVRTNIGAYQELPACSIDFLLEEDGTLVYMLSGRYESENTGDPALHMTLSTSMFGEETLDMDTLQVLDFTYALQNTAPTVTAQNAAPADYADCGVRVEKVKLTGTPMAIYYEIEFSVIDQEKYAATEDGLWFEFIDENGERLPSGAEGTGSVGPLDGSETRFIQHGSIEAANTLPAEVHLRGYSAWEKTRYETHVFQMK